MAATRTGAASVRAVEVPQPTPLVQSKAEHCPLVASTGIGGTEIVIETPILPVALRNNTITQGDYDAIMQRASELRAAKQPQSPLPPKIREGKRSKVRS